MKPLGILLGVICVLVLSGCKTTDHQAKVYFDEPFKKVALPYTTAFKYISGFSGQVVAAGQMDEIQAIKYYQNRRLVGFTNFAVNAWFSNITESELKQRVLGLMKRKSSLGRTTEENLSIYRNGEDFGAYIEKDGCTFLSFRKRLKGVGLADNDGGTPDFTGFFTLCEGLSVSPEKFIRSISLARNNDTALFLRTIK